jgi:hypothetical protein
MQSSNTQNTGEGGRPQIDDDNLTEAGATSRAGDNRKKDT